MKLEELITDIISKCPGNPEDVEVLLATRRVDGVLIKDPRQVWLREIAAVEVEEGGSALYFVPKPLLTREPDFHPPVTASALQTYAAENPHLAGCEVFVVDHRGQGENGRIFSMNLSILGVRAGAGSELWIIQYPQEQWPESWFA